MYKRLLLVLSHLSHFSLSLLVMSGTEDDVPLPSYKIVVLGDSSVGKTSLVHRVTTDTFEGNTPNTIGAAFITKDYSSKTNNRTIKFEIWDTAGQERYRSLTPMSYRNSRVALICYDLNNIDDSFSKAKYWIDQLKLNNDSSNDFTIKIKLIGTKSDVSNSKTSVEVNDFLQDNRDIKNYITSAKTGDGVESLFDNIIDEIDDSFFDNYYKKLEQERESNKNQKINILNSSLTSTNNNCC